MGFVVFGLWSWNLVLGIWYLVLGMWYFEYLPASCLLPPAYCFCLLFRRCIEQTQLFSSLLGERAVRVLVNELVQVQLA
jgi:hypothetical protein